MSPVKETQQYNLYIGENIECLYKYTEQIFGNSNRHILLIK